MINRNDREISHRSLQPFALAPLPLGAVRPSGWLHDQLRVQAEGLTGYLDEFWPSVADSRWIGGASEGWERAPYWLDGLAPLAILLQDERLIQKAQRWIDFILATQHEDGWLGPKEDPHEGLGEVTLDPWPLYIVFKVFTQWQEAIGDTRIVPALLRAARRIQTLLAEKPLRSWARVRWADLVISLHWLYERTGEAFLLDLAETACRQGFDWMANFCDFPYKERTDRSVFQRLNDEECLPLHGVNNAMGVKAGAVWSRQSGNPADIAGSLLGVAALDKYHGQVTGMFSGDEHLAGRNPSQGTETCTVTEYLYTLEQMLAVTGLPALADRLERIAYNALPASMTKDMWARQYDQQPNQVLCTEEKRNWVSNGPRSNIFSLEGNFGCCTANLHQGWPKFVSSLWMQTDDGIAAVAYAPSIVTREIAGSAVTIEEETEYPFRGDIRFTVRVASPVRFALRLRIPAWAEGASVEVSGEEQAAIPGEFSAIDREWQDGDTLTLYLTLALRRERRYNGAVSILRGPLVMALRIGEEFRQIGGVPPHADWAVHPTTPWNYGLVLGEGVGFEVSENAVSPLPFASGAPPVVISARARRLPAWDMELGSAAPPPIEETPLPSEETIELVPYGSTHLRISEFPTVMPVENRVAPRLEYATVGG